MKPLPREIEEIIRAKETRSEEDARFGRALRYSLNEMQWTNPYSSLRLVDILLLLKGENI